MKVGIYVRWEVSNWKLETGKWIHAANKNLRTIHEPSSKSYLRGLTRNWTGKNN